MSGHNHGGICIIAPSKDVYSETFIRAHIERYPGKVAPLYGRWFPYFRKNDDKPLMPLWVRIGCFLIRKIFRVEKFARRLEQGAWRRFLRDQGVKGVLAEYGPTGVAVMDACRKAGIPLVVHFHGYDAYDQRALNHEGRRYPELFNTAAAVIAVSRDMERQLLSLGARREKLHLNPYGVDTEKFKGTEPSKAPPVFVAVGRFVDKKAPFLTLLAFSRVIAAVPEARLFMIGEGPLWEACKQLSRALKIGDTVKFLGPRDHTEVAETMRQARAFVQHSVKPSYGDSEGTPVAVLEAGATGLPVIATRHAGIQDVIMDGETGFLVEEGDVESMADRMILIANNPDLAGKLGKAARERICAEFSAEKSFGHLWRIIEGAVTDG